jgi:hypothetical protein
MTARSAPPLAPSLREPQSVPLAGDRDEDEDLARDMLPVILAPDELAVLRDWALEEERVTLAQARYLLRRAIARRTRAQRRHPTRQERADAA